MTGLRPMREADVPAVHELKEATFDELDRRLGEEPPPRRDPRPSHVRLRHVLETDPEGAWVAEDDKGLTGCAMSLVREGLWGLSLLVVRPGLQSAGLGRALLRAAHDHGGPQARARMVLSSSDSRALRSYARLGLTPHPCLHANGVPREVAGPAGVREGTLADLDFTDALDRRVRRAAHGSDMAALLAAGRTLLVAPERGYAVVGHGELTVLAAVDEAAARELLRAVLARADGASVHVGWMTGAQGWAVHECVAAGLELSCHGAFFVDGDTGPLHPYLPNGSYL
jgi:GNAT superfamily N-acetyltransferase